MMRSFPLPESQIDKEAKTVEEAARNVVRYYRDTVSREGFVGNLNVEEWIRLCEVLGEPTTRQDISPFIGAPKGTTAEIWSAAKAVLVLYRDYLFPGGFVGSFRIKEWVQLCEVLGESTVTQYKDIADERGGKEVKPTMKFIVAENMKVGQIAAVGADGMLRVWTETGDDPIFSPNMSDAEKESARAGLEGREPHGN
jgi:hypothetical protein